ncbi:MAG: adaptor protein MecA [Lachnospiraceae bacterium]|nr:adaptor protein MecA [Lachnospiraceae bacterium]
MKIEKVNENQIRCTLTREDLASRELKISELAYGTEKAKSLFRDMMQQAAFELGFEAEDIPLMIEAIPLNAECIVLIITKVEDPEELDTRFSKFSPSIHDASEREFEETMEDLIPGTDEVLDLFKRIHETRSKAIEAKASEATEASKPKDTEKSVPATPVAEINLTRIFTFDTLDKLLRLSKILCGNYDGTNSLYKESETGTYLLVLSQDNHTPEQFNRICNILSEYGSAPKSIQSGQAFLEEHCSPLISRQALQSLAKMN